MVVSGAMTLAQTILATPIVMALIHRAVEEVLWLPKIVSGLAVITYRRASIHYRVRGRTGSHPDLSEGFLPDLRLALSAVPFGLFTISSKEVFTTRRYLALL
jgi:hypothetical protein